MIYPDNKAYKTADGQKAGVEQVTEKVALVLAFVSVFVFFLKILFF